ncbi:MAG: hypothetical protein LBJ59_03090 [Zoogloeaceae bacterium]|jgi:hypothetical protein|nr:hypothetical protein [Zoogloeaceae bacterium]
MNLFERLKKMLGRVITGAILVVLGLLLLVANLRFFNLNGAAIMATWWPLGLLLLGSLLINLRAWFLGVTLALYGLLFLAIELGLLQAHVASLIRVWWPLGILIVGVALIVNRRV